MVRTKKEKTQKPSKNRISKDSIPNDDVSNIDIKGDGMIVVDIKNESVSNVVVTKNTENDTAAGEIVDNATGKTEDTQASIYNERVAMILGDKMHQETISITDDKVINNEKSPTKQEILNTKKDELASATNALYQSAKTDIKESKNIHKTKGLTAKLGRVGVYIGSLYQNSNQASNNYQAVDLTDDFDMDIFRKQSGQAVSQLFGTKGATIQNLAKTVVSDDKLLNISQTIYAKLAAWAKAWALKDLANDSRFDNLETLTESQKASLADEVANQNRALATLGGITGLMGLKGVVLDTAWLLMVSLKSVYQFAAIYGQPLDGKDGVNIVYGILSKCNLDKLQEKQVIMTALALGNTVLINAQSTSLADELKKIGQQYQNHSHSVGFDLLSNYVDLDKLNFKGLRLLISTASVTISAHYNNELIGEVFGVARATFSNKKTEPKLLEDKSQ